MIRSPDIITVEITVFGENGKVIQSPTPKTPLRVGPVGPSFSDQHPGKMGYTFSVQQTKNNMTVGPNMTFSFKKEEVVKGDQQWLDDPTLQAPAPIAPAAPTTAAAGSAPTTTVSPLLTGAAVVPPTAGGSSALPDPFIPSQILAAMGQPVAAAPTEADDEAKVAAEVARQAEEAASSRPKVPMGNLFPKKEPVGTKKKQEEKTKKGATETNWPFWALLLVGICIGGKWIWDSQQESKTQGTLLLGTKDAGTNEGHVLTFEDQPIKDASPPPAPAVESHSPDASVTPEQLRRCGSGLHPTNQGVSCEPRGEGAIRSLQLDQGNFKMVCQKDGKKRAVLMRDTDFTEATGIYLSCFRETWQCDPQTDADCQKRKDELTNGGWKRLQDYATDPDKL